MLLLINAVGLTPRLLEYAPRLKAVAHAGWRVAMQDVLPAVTCTAQATLLTGEMPEQHGIVGNGWLFRDTQEVRFWQQSNRLMQAEPLYVTARKRAKEQGKSVRCAKLFWWFNQGADVDISVTPKPYYGYDGNKVFGITGTPEGYTDQLEKQLGPFPFHTFWGPMAGLPCTQWIARCAAKILLNDRPDLTFVYLPHLDYDPQRFGPQGCDMPKLVQQLDEACTPLLDAAQETGTQVWVVSEYGHCQVDQVIYPNRYLRQAKLLTVRDGPFGEQLDLYGSKAFAVCDHQLAHVYVKQMEDIPSVAEQLRNLSGVAKLYVAEERSQIHLKHERAGEIVLLSEPNAWFAYPYWLNDARAPDYARAVAIHHKPGYDPAELFLDPNKSFVKPRIAWKLLRKKLGFRMLLDVIPLDASIVKGSHGLIAADAQDGPLLIGHGPKPQAPVPMTAVKEFLLRAMGLG